jgi:hypothetical protein
MVRFWKQVKKHRCCTYDLNWRFILKGNGMEMLIAMEFFLFFIVAGLFILWIWALVDIIKSKFQEDLMQIVWLLVVFFLPFLGVLLYLLIGRSMKQSIQQKDNDPTLRYAHLEKLKTLLDSGVISETEFEAEKEKILNS